MFGRWFGAWFGRRWFGVSAANPQAGKWRGRRWFGDWLKD